MRRKLWIPVGVSVGGGTFSLFPSLGWSTQNGSRSLMNLLRAGRTKQEPSFPPVLRGARPAPQGFSDEEPLNDRKRSFWLCETQERSYGGVSPLLRGLCELMIAGWGTRRVAWGPSWVQGSGLSRAQLQDGFGAREPGKFVAGTAPPRLEQPLVGKPRAGAFTAEPCPSAPLRGSPSLSLETRKCRKPERGPLEPLSLLSPRVRTSQRQAAGASHSPHGPRSEGARLQQRLPVFGGGEIARRPQGGRPPGKLEGHSL